MKLLIKKQSSLKIRRKEIWQKRNALTVEGQGTVQTGVIIDTEEISSPFQNVIGARELEKLR